MARHLLNRQKAIIDKFIAENTRSDEDRMIYGSVFTEDRHYLDADDIPHEVWSKIQAINDTEILYQEVNRYMSDKCTEIVHR